MATATTKHSNSTDFVGIQLPNATKDRIFPLAIQRFVLSFLNLDDVGSVLLASRDFNIVARACLEQLATVEFFTDEMRLSRMTFSPVLVSRKAVVHAILQCCRRLRRLDCRLVWQRWGGCFQDKMRPLWWRAVVRNNQTTLEKVWAPESFECAGLPCVFQCPNIAVLHDVYVKSKTSAKALSRCSNLHTLSVLGDLPLALRVLKGIFCFTVC